MPRKPKPPSYLQHRGQDGKIRARVRINGKDRFLGAYGSPESYARYKQILIEWESGAYRAESPAPSNLRTIADGAVDFLAHLANHRPSKNELVQYRRAFRTLTDMFGQIPLATFGPKSLRLVLRRYVEEGLCRRVANRHLVRLKTMLRWLVREEHMQAVNLSALLTVGGLHKGEFASMDYDPVLPVPESDLDATLPCLCSVVRAAVEFQLWTGARPGEALRLRPCDILRGQAKTVILPGVAIDTRKVWIYCPARIGDRPAHKTEHHGRSRYILIGPRAQAIIAPFLERAADAYCFSPREAAEAFLRAKGRKIVHARKRMPGELYQSSSYVRAIAKACQRAKVPHWHPNQLRHSCASRVASEFGPDVARIVLGHSGFDLLKVYVLDDLQKAAKAVGKVG